MRFARQSASSSNCHGNGILITSATNIQRRESPASPEPWRRGARASEDIHLLTRTCSHSPERCNVNHAATAVSLASFKCSYLLPVSSSRTDYWRVVKAAEPNYTQM